MKKETPVNSSGLKSALWDTLNQVKAGTMSPTVANSVATQAREILRTVKVELDIGRAGKTVTRNTKSFLN